MTEPLRPGRQPDERKTSDDVYRALAERLGIDAKSCRDGPQRGPLAGPSVELPLDALLRLSEQMERLATEIERMPSRTYRAQLWHQWRALWRP